jgi:hypothetical protein
VIGASMSCGGASIVKIFVRHLGRRAKPSGWPGSM